MLEYYRDLKIRGVELLKCAVGSEGDSSRRLAEGSGWNYVEFANDPLGAKHNAGMKWFRDKGCAAVITIGSDDLLNKRYFAAMLQKIKEGLLVVSLEDVYYLNGAACYHVRNAAPGAGRMLAHPLLKNREYKAWPDEAKSLLDGAMHSQIIQYANPGHRHINDCAAKGIICMDIKGGRNMHSFEKMKSRLGEDRFTKVNGKSLFRKEFPGIWEKLKELPVEV